MMSFAKYDAVTEIVCILDLRRSNKALKMLSVSVSHVNVISYLRRQAHLRQCSSATWQTSHPSSNMKGVFTGKSTISSHSWQV